jgi:hypothetical protein
VQFTLVVPEVLDSTTGEVAADADMLIISNEAAAKYAIETRCRLFKCFVPPSAFGCAPVRFDKLRFVR